jgi:hypothetical protein
VAAFFQVIDWDFVGERYRKALSRNYAVAKAVTVWK